MDFLVQKFGGTSLGTAERMHNVASIVESFLKENHVIAVVSAMSSYIKTEGTTSKLIAASEAALNDGPYFKILNEIEENHFKSIEEAVTDKKIQEETKESIALEIKKLRFFLDAIGVIGEMSAKSEDNILSIGEKFSARILAAVLASKGIDSEYVSLDGIIKKSFESVGPNFYLHLKQQITNRLALCENKVPVVTGFFGQVPNGILASIGRGYTDFTAAVVAAAKKAKELQIWKEVDGVFSADPRKIKNANVLKSISPDEAAELTYFGSEVIHPFTMEQAVRAQIPIRIKNTFSPELKGTIVDPSPDYVPQNKPVATTVKHGVTIVNINSNRMFLAYGFLAKVFNILDKYQLSVDLISTSEVNISMTLNRGFIVDKAIEDLEKLGEVTIKKNMSIISLVGKGMQYCIGTSGKMFNALADAGINIEMITQGASEINISCVVKEDDAENALKVVHKALLED